MSNLGIYMTWVIFWKNRTFCCPEDGCRGNGTLSLKKEHSRITRDVWQP